MLDERSRELSVVHLEQPRYDGEDLRQRYLFYISIVFGTLIFAGGIVLGTNYILDPLWYFGGNHLAPKNYLWNERFSKVNQYLKDPEIYDCVIVGSSRTILLDEDNISGHKCFNFAAGAGRIPEFYDFIRYFSEKSGKAALIIVGIDSINLLADNEMSNEVPDFVRSLRQPPGPWTTYVSPKIFVWSVRSAMELSPNPYLYYTQSFHGSILPSSRHYVPGRELKPGFADRQYPLSGFTIESARHYWQFRKFLSPRGRMVGYAPPVTAYYIARLAISGGLESYLKSLYMAAKAFDEFYDFTVPSHWTKSPENTVDGAHYVPSVNEEIAKIMSGKSNAAGIAVHKMSWREYRDTYRAEVEKFMHEKDIGSIAVSKLEKF